MYNVLDLEHLSNRRPFGMLKLTLPNHSGGVDLVGGKLRQVAIFNVGKQAQTFDHAARKSEKFVGYVQDHELGECGSLLFKLRT